MDKSANISQHTRFGKSPTSGPSNMTTYTYEGVKPRYTKQFSRPFPEGEGPSDFNNSQIYNQGFTEFVQEQLDLAKVDRHFGIDSVSENIEGIFKENLIRRFD